MSFSAMLGQRFVVGISTHIKASERAVRYTLDEIVGAGDEVFLCHVLVLSPNSVHFADTRRKQIQRMVDKKLAPIFEARRIHYVLLTVQITLPLFMGQNPAFLVGQAMCEKAAGLGAAAIILGGTGKDHLLLTLLLGHSISYTVRKHASMPAILVGPRTLPTAPDLSRIRMNPDLFPSLARHCVIAAAA